ncbi:MAG: hypothetical protein K2R98_30020 [Gemmataceae bacterium]|nr:hypothetical protein [Gemmataceae bacterium]
MMRADTLASAEVIGYLNEHYVIAWSNLLPELYGNADPNAPPPPKYNPEHVKSVPEGAGGGNIRIYFCNPQGRVLHQVIGYWKPDRFLDEARFAASLFAMSPDRVIKVQTQRREELEKEQATAMAALPVEPKRNDPAARCAAQVGLRCRAANDLRKELHADIEDLLDRRREEVYTKGAVGCDH